MAKKFCGILGICIKNLPAQTVSILLRVFNLTNAVLLGVTCYFAYQIANSITRAFLATYIGLFALILFLFETRVRWSAQIIRRNFGFLFTYTGRTFFIIFLGAVCFGMLDSDKKSTNGYKWCLGVGIATMANAIFNCFIICNHPQFQDLNKANMAKNETAGNDPSKMTEAQIKAYLNAHPEVAAAALGHDKGSPAPADSVAVPIGTGVTGKQEPATWFGGKKKASPKESASVPAPATYVPPVIPEPVPSSSSSGYVPSSVAPTAQPDTSAPPTSVPNAVDAFAIGDVEENPFATSDYN